jgi:integrase
MPGTSAKLTKRAVDAATAQTGRYLVWDTELKGFGLRVAPSGTKTYFVRYRPRNMGSRAPKRFVVIGRHGPLTPDEARVRARALLGAVAAGHDPAIVKSVPAATLSIARLVDLFIEEHVKAKRKSRTAESYAAVLKGHLVPQLGKRPANEITTSEVEQLHLLMRDRPQQANRLLAIVGSMYGYAAKRGLLPKGTNPVVGIERYRSSQRERYLTGEELKRFGGALRLAETTGLPWHRQTTKTVSKHLPALDNQKTVFAPEVALAFRLLLFTGARLREILHLEWRFIDLERGLFLLPDSKTGRKTVVLSEVVIDLLRDARRLGPFVIPGQLVGRPRSDLKKPWQAIQRHAGLEGVRLHDLRHTFASIGAGASLGLPIVGKLLGHSQPATTARYAHLDADPLRRASDLIGAHLASAMAARRIEQTD